MSDDKNTTPLNTPDTPVNIQKLDLRLPSQLNTGNNKYTYPSSLQGGTYDSQGMLGMEKYYGDNNLPNLTTDQIIRDIDKNRQGGLESAGLGIARFFGDTAILTTQGTLGMLYGVGSMIANRDLSKLFDNSFARTLDKASEGLHEKLKIYQSKEDRAKGLGQVLDVDFWADEVLGGLSFTASAVLSEMAMSSLTALTGGAAAGLQAAGTARLLAQATQRLRGLVGAQKLSKFAKAVDVGAGLGNAVQLSKAPRVARQIMFGAGFEAGVEARHFMDQARETAINTFIEREGRRPFENELADIEKDVVNASNAVFGLNMALVGGTNMITLPKIFGIGAKAERTLGKKNFVKTAGLSEKQIGRAVDRMGLGSAADLPEFVTRRSIRSKAGNIIDTAKVLGKQPLYEGIVEEGGQSAITAMAENYLVEKYAEPNREATVNLANAIIDGLVNTYGGDGWQEMGVGMIIGALGIPGRSGGKWQMVGGIAQEMRDLGIKTDAANDIIKRYVQDASLAQSVKTAAQNVARQHGLVNRYNEAIRQGDLFEAKNVEHDMLFSQAYGRYRMGHFDSMKDDVLDLVDSMDNKEFAEAFLPGLNLSNDEIQKRKAETRQSFADRMDAIKEGISIADSIYEGTNNDVSEELAWTFSLKKDMDRREQAIADHIASKVEGVDGRELMEVMRSNNRMKFQAGWIKTFNQKLQKLKRALRRQNKAIADQTAGPLMIQRQKLNDENATALEIKIDMLRMDLEESMKAEFKARKDNAQDAPEYMRDYDAFAEQVLKLAEQANAIDKHYESNPVDMQDMNEMMLDLGSIAKTRQSLIDLHNVLLNPNTRNALLGKLEAEAESRMDDAARDQKIKDNEQKENAVKSSKKKAKDSSGAEPAPTSVDPNEPPTAAMADDEAPTATNVDPNEPPDAKNVGPAISADVAASLFGRKKPVPTSTKKDDIERRRQEELKKYEGRRANSVVKYNPDGENLELTNEEVEEVEMLINAAKERGYNADRTMKMLQSRGFVQSVNNTASAFKEFLAARLSGEINNKVNEAFLDEINAKYDAELAALEESSDPVADPFVRSQVEITPTPVAEADIKIPAIVQAVLDEVNKNREFIFLHKSGDYYYRDTVDADGNQVRMKYRRVTDYISEGERPESSALIDSASTIGKGIDTIIRDFFNGELKEYAEYKQHIKTEKAFAELIESLNGIRETMNARGEKVYANGVILYNDELGIAGEVDLLTVDSAGNIRIYDMKTFRSDPRGKYRGDNAIIYDSTEYNDLTYREKHTRQLNMYRILLNNTHGLKAKSLGIMPIKVQYKPGDTSTSEARLLKGFPIEVRDKVLDAEIVDPVLPINESTESFSRTEDEIDEHPEQRNVEPDPAVSDQELEVSGTTIAYASKEYVVHPDGKYDNVDKELAPGMPEPRLLLPGHYEAGTRVVIRPVPRSDAAIPFEDDPINGDLGIYSEDGQLIGYVHKPSYFDANNSDERARAEAIRNAMGGKERMSAVIASKGPGLMNKNPLVNGEVEQVPIAEAWTSDVVLGAIDSASDVRGKNREIINRDYANQSWEALPVGIPVAVLPTATENKHMAVPLLRSKVGAQMADIIIRVYELYSEAVNGHLTEERYELLKQLEQVTGLPFSQPEGIDSAMEQFLGRYVYTTFKSKAPDPAIVEGQDPSEGKHKYIILRTNANNRKIPAKIEFYETGNVGQKKGRPAPHEYVHIFEEGTNREKFRAFLEDTLVNFDVRLLGQQMSFPKYVDGQFIKDESIATYDDFVKQHLLTNIHEIKVNDGKKDVSTYFFQPNIEILVEEAQKPQAPARPSFKKLKTLSFAKKGTNVEATASSVLKNFTRENVRSVVVELLEYISNNPDVKTISGSIRNIAQQAPIWYSVPMIHDYIKGNESINEVERAFRDVFTKEEASFLAKALETRSNPLTSNVPSPGAATIVTKEETQQQTLALEKKLNTRLRDLPTGKITDLEGNPVYESTAGVIANGLENLTAKKYAHGHVRSDETNALLLLRKLLSGSDFTGDFGPIKGDTAYSAWETGKFIIASNLLPPIKNGKLVLNEIEIILNAGLSGVAQELANEFPSIIIKDFNGRKYRPDANQEPKQAVSLDDLFGDYVGADQPIKTNEAKVSKKDKIQKDNNIC